MVDRPMLRRRRNLGQIIGDGLGVYTSRLLPMLLILALPGLCLNLSLLAIALNTSGWGEFFLTDPTGFIGGALLGTGAIYALDQADRGRGTHPGQALLEALHRAQHLIYAKWQSSIIFILFFITIVGIPWAFNRLFRWWFVTHVIMLEDQEGGDSLEQSAQLVAGRGWPTAGLLIGAGILVWLPSLLVNVVLMETAGQVTAGLVNAGGTAITFPYATATTLMVYYDLKLRKEATA